MNCPSCDTLVPEGAVICEHCDHILDTSFLGGDITNEDEPIRHDEDGATRIKIEAPVEEATRIKAAPTSPRPKPARPAPRPALYEDDDGEVTAQGRAARRLDELAAPSEATTEAIDEFVNDFKNMALSQKLTVVGATTVLVALALPWKGSKNDGDIIGLLGGGWFAGLLAVLVLVAMFARRHPLIVQWKQQVLLAVAGVSLATGLTCVVYMKSALEHRTVHSAGRLLRENVSWPSFGVYVGLIASMVMLGGALKSWMDRDVLPD